MANTINSSGEPRVYRGSLAGTAIRYHELALQRWLNEKFVVNIGYPTPVVFSNPVDAYAHFQQLWKKESGGNPFAYLLGALDDKGTPLYQPYPSPARYPLISVKRKGWKYRPNQNFSIHRWRHIDWPTIANANPPVNGVTDNGANLKKEHLGNVTTSRMPMAWDFRFQLDHFCLRPDSQAHYVGIWMEEFWKSGGGPQTWMVVNYPNWGPKLVRMYLDGDIEDSTPEQPEDGSNVEFRTTANIVIEGFSVDLAYENYPALWKLIMRDIAVSPDELQIAMSVDLRERGANPSIDNKQNIPDSDQTLVS